MNAPMLAKLDFMSMIANLNIHVKPGRAVSFIGYTCTKTTKLFHFPLAFSLLSVPACTRTCCDRKRLDTA